MLEKKIPTIFALLIIIAGMLAALNLAGKTTTIRTKANPTAEIKELTISNIYDDGFTVSWLTDGDFPQYVVVTESSKKSFCQPEYGVSLGPCYYDERDVETHVPSKNKTHHVNIDGLSANSKYSVRIYTSGSTDVKTFKEIENKAIATGPTVQGTASSAVIYGNFYLLDGKTPANGALIYLLNDKGSKISSISKPSGAWLLTMNKLRTPLGENEPFTLEIKADVNTKMSIKATLAASQPLPNVNIGQAENLDFTTNLPTSAPNPQGSFSPQGNKSGFSVPTPNPVGGGIPLSLINPSQNSSVDDLPTFRGTADPGQTIEIEVNSETPITATVKTDANGNWFWTPPSNLSPGDHTVAITVIDKDGNRQTITKSFTVSALANTLPLTAGSESASIRTPSPTPEIVSTPAPTPVPTQKSKSQEIPTTGYSSPFIILLTSGMVFATMGLWLLFNRKRYY